MLFVNWSAFCFLQTIAKRGRVEKTLTAIERKRGSGIMSYLLGVVNLLSWGEMSAIIQRCVCVLKLVCLCVFVGVVDLFVYRNTVSFSSRFTISRKNFGSGLKLPLVPVLLLPESQPLATLSPSG